VQLLRIDVVFGINPVTDLILAAVTAPPIAFSIAASARGRHNLVACIVRVKAIFGEFPFEQAFVVHHGGEIIHVQDSVCSAVVFKPLVQLEDSRARALREEVFRFLRVVVNRKNSM